MKTEHIKNTEPLVLYSGQGPDIYLVLPRLKSLEADQITLRQAHPGGRKYPYPNLGRSGKKPGIITATLKRILHLNPSQT